ncbi:NAD-dependent epimerase/dehydratase family protein [Pedobacter glucosidilyticus]|uniref:NAD-dependent epimerase/dehydratase family protein n=1 Tax=Pedobacter glucosidilyticus TaxID=1122941 RepID=UPI0026F25A22|nr:NAD-dependent epimerase/dehydratase family protein [Pedobacter glucosidilyticus]
MILITGATGFLGAQLTKQLLAHESKVRCIKRASSVIPEILKPLHNQIDWVDADILDIADLTDAFEGITHVYHCAAYVSLNNYNEKEMMAINVDGTANIVNLCLSFGITKLLHVSSIAALGQVKPGETITENHYWDAYDKNGAYAISKYRAEMEVWRGVEEGLKVVIVNPSLIIGAGIGKQGSGKIFETVKKGLNYYTSGGTGLVDVEDVAELMIKLMKHEVVNERFILNAENYSFKQLFTETAIALNLKAPEKELKEWQAKLFWRLGHLLRILKIKIPVVSKDLLKAAFQTQQYSNQKVSTLFSYQFTPVKSSITKSVNGIKSF